MKQIKDICRVILAALLLVVMCVPWMVVQHFIAEKYAGVVVNLWWKIVTRFGLIKTKS